MVQIRMGNGGYIPAESWRVWLPSRMSGPCPAIVACHGGGGEERMMDRDWHPELHDNMVEIVERSGFAILIPDHTTAQEPTGAHTWGNDESTDAVMAMLIWARENYNISESPVVMWGGSMGHVTSWAFAKKFPDEVAAFVHVAGAVNLDHHHESDNSAVGGYMTMINNAHDGADYATVIKPKADPMTIASDPTLVRPWIGWWGDDDPVGVVSDMQEFAALVDGTLNIVPGGDHTTTFGETSPDIFVEFLNEVV